MAYAVHVAMLWAIPALLKKGWVGAVGFKRAHQARCEGKQDSQSLMGLSVEGGKELALRRQTVTTFTATYLSHTKTRQRKQNQISL